MAGETHKGEATEDEGSGTEKTRAMLGSLASGMVSIFSVQLMSRILTFALNIMIARSVDRKVYGIGSVQMGLVCDAVLALSREGFRDACQRTPARDWQDAKSRGRVLAVAWLCVPFAAFVGIVVWNVSSYFGSGQAEGGVSAAGISAMFIAAAGLEMLSEPLYILAHNMLLINIRVRVEIFALVSRVVTTSTLITLYPETPLRAFALGQISYGAAMLTGFSAYFSLSQQGLGFRETLGLLSGWRSLSLLLSSRGHAGGRGNEAGGGGEVPGGGGGG